MPKQASIERTYLHGEVRVVVRMTGVDSAGRANAIISLHHLADGGSFAAPRRLDPFDALALRKYFAGAASRNGGNPRWWSDVADLVRVSLEDDPAVMSFVTGDRPLATPDVVRLADVPVEPVRWVWPLFIPAGKLTVVAGDPGLGKTLAVLDIMARITVAGETPDRAGRFAGGNAIIVSAEDAASDTLRPRVERQGGDSNRVFVLRSITEPDGTVRDLDLTKDLPLLREQVLLHDAVLIALDPLEAFLGGVDANRNAEVRRVLASLRRLAEETGVAVVVITHLSKGAAGKAIYRVLSSIGITAAARSVLLVAEERNDPNQRVLLQIKANLAALAPPIGFHITGDGILAWDDTVEADPRKYADELLAPVARVDPEGTSKVEEAKRVITETLKDGPRTVQYVQRVARQMGISEHTLRRARDELGITMDDGNIYREGTPWYWKLPE